MKVGFLLLPKSSDSHAGTAVGSLGFCISDSTGIEKSVLLLKLVNAYGRHFVSLNFSLRVAEMCH
ncbi:MAG: hypothetical protein GX348_00695 [Veillonellaceae bacterium]|nr:hypothetical protein [Veillonellaceae bacterium]